MLNKKAQVGEGITWIFATIVIIVFLVAAVLITDKLVEVKGWATKAREIFSLKEQTEKIDKDFIFSKSVSSFLLVKSSDSEKLFGLKPTVEKYSKSAPVELLWSNLVPANLILVDQLINILIDTEVNYQQGSKAENLENLFIAIKSQASFQETSEKL